MLIHLISNLYKYYFSNKPDTVKEWQPDIELLSHILYDFIIWLH